MIEVENLVKRYGGRNVVDHLSFSVEDKQILGFLGPNGAGKSTTMNIITGYISATEGTVKINGYNILEEPEKAKACIGYLPEQPPLYPDMFVREYLTFVCGLKGVKKQQRERMLTKVMRMTRTGDVSERLIKHLSKGYRQRVGLAAALIGNPPVLILDEPMVGLDPKQILEMRDLIRELSKNHTILLSSHIMQEVSAVCNQILIINEGRLVVSERPENVGKNLDSTRSIRMLVKGDKEQIAGVLENVDYIEKVSIENTKETNICKAEVMSQADHDIRESLFYTMAEAKCAILEMVMREPTLEEAFISLTGDGSSPQNKREEKAEKKTEIKEVP